MKQVKTTPAACAIAALQTIRREAVRFLEDEKLNEYEAACILDKIKMLAERALAALKH